MDLTLKERLILSNQLKILEALYPDDVEYYSRQRKAVDCGFKLHYSWLAEHIDENELSEADCRFVLDVLGMYRALDLARRRFGDSAEFKDHDLRFRGFDGNEEADLYSYTLYFVVELDRFKELRDDNEYPDFNSHMPMRNRYQQMLEVFNKISPDGQLNLSSEQLRSILET